MDLVITTPKVPKLGETILGSGFMTVPGGKGAQASLPYLKDVQDFMKSIDGLGQ